MDNRIRSRATMFGMCLFVLSLAGTSAMAETYGGIDFPSGPISFADRVVSFDPLFSGGPGPFEVPGFPNTVVDPNRTLGPPRFTSDENVALGNGGRLTLEFTDNALVGSGDTGPDLYVFESGTAEGFSVDISKAGMSWTALGVVSGSSAFDIDAFGFGPSDRFHFVRITDVPRSAPPDYVASEGADIDAVGAISTVPEPSTVTLTALAGLVIAVRGRRRPV